MRILLICSVNADGSYNKTFYNCLSHGQVKNIRQTYDFETDIPALQAETSSRQEIDTAESNAKTLYDTVSQSEKPR